MEVIGGDEKKAIFEMVRGTLKFSPSDRMSAQQVLETEWMREWAIPEAEKTWRTGGPLL